MRCCVESRSVIPQAVRSRVDDRVVSQQVWGAAWSPAVQQQGLTPLDRVKRVGHVVHDIARQRGRSHPHQLAALVRLTDDRLTAPPLEDEEQVQVLHVALVLGR